MAEKTITEIKKAFKDAKELIGKMCSHGTDFDPMVIQSVKLHFENPRTSARTVQFFEQNEFVIELLGGLQSVPYNMDDPPIVEVPFPTVENTRGIRYVSRLVQEPENPERYYWTFGCAKISHNIIEEAFFLLNENTSRKWETEKNWRIPTEIKIGDAYFSLTKLKEMIEFYDSYMSKE